MKIEGWSVKPLIPRAKVALVKQMFKAPAWEQPLGLLEWYDTFPFFVPFISLCFTFTFKLISFVVFQRKDKVG